MSKTVECAIVSIEEELFCGQVTKIMVTGSEGSLGILPKHSPLLAELSPGPVYLDDIDGNRQVFYLSGGYIEILPKEVKILADTAIRAADLDEAAAEEARQQATKLLLVNKGEFDYGQAAVRLAEAAAQLRTIQELKKFKK